ncbi:hypothetical protein E2C01_078043 [Portunus trituberculatus]|uniref:Uncharacterized protein n=1 Tax=Portunus trituberculatus TaxID=210409 RepID=A0A5B7ILU8_PORTR|nr:hypothetical protein [Portunus trituberculatus]
MGYKSGSQEENRDLIDRWMAQKAKDAEKLNLENDSILSAKSGPFSSGIWRVVPERRLSTVFVLDKTSW